jgi:hypothetical protein
MERDPSWLTANRGPDHRTVPGLADVATLVDVGTFEPARRGGAARGLEAVRITVAGDVAEVVEGDSEGGLAFKVSMNPNNFFETPWNGSRVRTNSGGRAVSGEKSAAARALQMPPAVVSSTKSAVTR